MIQHCKDCDTELVTMASQNRGLCNKCDGKQRDAAKAKVLDEHARLDRLEDVVAALTRLELARRANPTVSFHHTHPNEYKTLETFIEEIEG